MSEAKLISSDLFAVPIAARTDVDTGLFRMHRAARNQGVDLGDDSSEPVGKHTENKGSRACANYPLRVPVAPELHGGIPSAIGTANDLGEALPPLSADAKQNQ